MTSYWSFIAEGHSVLYDREAPFELRIQDPNNGPQEVGTLEAIRVKILVLVRLSLNRFFFIKNLLSLARIV